MAETRNIRKVLGKLFFKLEEVSELIAEKPNSKNQIPYS